MSDVLVTFLGRGEYVPVRYQYGGRTSEKSEEFVQAALVELLQHEAKDLRVLPFVTPEVLQHQNFARLRDRLGDRLLQEQEIESPKSENDVWTVFEKVVSCVGEGDRVWFDVTNGFRALPIIAVQALSFVRHVKTFSLEGLLYGAFEARVDDVAPIFDLTAMLVLPEWGEALGEWRRTGRADGLVKQTKPYLEQVQREQRQRTALTGIADALQQLSDALTMVRHDVPGALADEAVKRLAEADADLPSHPSMKPLALILGPLKQDIEELRGTPKYDPDTAKERAVTIDAEYLRRLVKTGKWLLERKRVAEGSTTLREAITACAVSLVRHGGVDEVLDGKNRPWHHDKFRTMVDRGLQVLSGAEKEEKFNPDAPHNKVLSEKLADDKLKDAARQALLRLRDPRNKLSHAWTSGEHTRESFSKDSARKFIDGLREAATAVDSLVELTIAATSDGQPQEKSLTRQLMTERLLLISTCGTSLLTNGASPEERAWLTKVANDIEVDSAHLDPIIEARREALIAADGPTRRKMSAELNGIEAVIERYAPKRRFHVLVHTDTALGKATARLVQQALDNESSLVSAKDLRTNDPALFRAALAELTKELEVLVQAYREQGWFVVFNLTGGFKSLNGYLQTLAMISADRCGFIFESTTELMEIPRLPVRLAELDELREHVTLFRRLAVGYSVQANDAKGVPESLLLEVDGEVTTSVLGDVAWARHRSTLFAERLLPPISGKVRVSDAVYKAFAGLSTAQKVQVNEALDEFSAHVNHERPLLKSRTFKKLQGNPKSGSTHELYAWSDGATGRLFGHYDADGVFVFDTLDGHL